MVEQGPTGQYVAECFWPGVDETAVRALDERASGSAAESTRAGDPVAYRGSLLMCRDEVVLCLFEGSEGAVRRVAERAAIPFERILEATGFPRPAPETT